MALMGEKGPEAVLPLRRGAGGKLGVSAALGMRGSGGGSEVNVFNYGSSQVETRDRGTAGGKPRFDIIIRDMVRDVMRGDISSGTGMASEMERAYGLDRTRGMG